MYFTQFILCKTEVFCGDSKSHVKGGMGFTKPTPFTKVHYDDQVVSSSLFIGKGVGLGFPFMGKKDHLSPGARSTTKTDCFSSLSDGPLSFSFFNACENLQIVC